MLTFDSLYLMACVFISHYIGLSNGIKLGEYRMKEIFREITKQEKPTLRSTEHD